MHTLYSLLIALLLASWAPFVAAEEEPLDPEQAFVLSLEAVDADEFRARWNIADGYYLYASKFRFRSETPGITFGEPQLPPGIQKNDEFFGEITIYKESVEVIVPLIRESGSSPELTLVATSQGCAEIGICYPPHHQSRTLQLVQASSTDESSTLAPLAADLLGPNMNGDDEVLDPEQAFRFDGELDGNTAVLRWDIAPEHYLYRDKLEFRLLDAGGASLGEAQIPPGEEKHDEFFGLIRVHYGLLEVRIPLQGNGLPPGATLEAKYQGCAARGICYPPQKKQLVLTPRATQDAASAPAAPVTQSSAASTTPSLPSADLVADDEPLSEQDTLAAALAGDSTLLTILTFFGLGLLLAFTPCVFPMIPILSSIIVGQGKGLTTRRAFVLSLVYVLAMALTYTIAGVIAGLFGSNLQATFQNPWILGSFAGLFVLLSLSMFGFYELQLPSSWQSKLSDISNKQQGGTLAGVGIMGALSALIVGPCVAPPLMGALIYIGQSGDALLGGGALFALSLGMGLPLIAIGTSAGKLLPRAGAWMDAVKAVFGVAMLAVAIWMLERIIPATITMLLWASLLIISAIYMGATDPVHEGSSGWTRLWKGLGFILLVYGVLLMVGTAAGSHNPLQPLEPLRASAASAGFPGQPTHLSFKHIKSVDDLQREVAGASDAGRPVMLDFYADWCTYCKTYERDVFPDPQVVAAAGDAVLLQADVTDNDELDQALLRHLGITAPPAILFYGRDGSEKQRLRIVGPMDAEAFTSHLKRAFGE